LLDEFINRNPAADNLVKEGLDMSEKVEVFRSL
ncbi:MAG: hypothetical protein RL423_539, partial [Bacteroidota bacterium]